WAKRLAARHGFARVDCDALVEQRLGPQLNEAGGGTAGMAKWMGLPHESRYAATSRTYLECEKDVMREVLGKLQTAQKPLAIDTTGSVIYTGEEIGNALRKLTRVVYLEASPAHVEQLFEMYFSSPKPTIWGDAYAPRAGEEPRETMRR